MSFWKRHLYRKKSPDSIGFVPFACERKQRCITQDPSSWSQDLFLMVLSDLVSALDIKDLGFYFKNSQDYNSNINTLPLNCPIYLTVGTTTNFYHY